MTPILWLVLSALAGTATPPPPGTAAFTIRIVTPDPLYLVGAARLRAEAIGPDGAPHPDIAWMQLRVDGLELPPDSKPPFEWSFDAGDSLRRRRLELSAIARDGSRVTTSVMSSTHPFVEAVGVNLVLVPVVVRADPAAAGAAGAGAAIAGLTQADFTLLEDGHPRAITAFSDEAAPASVAIALDNSLSMEKSLWSARQAILDFLEALPAASAVSFLTFNDQVFLEQDFTYDLGRLGSAVAAARAEGSRTALYDTLRTASRHLSGRPGVRVLVLFTDGADTLYEDDPGRLTTAIQAAQSADVAVFAVAYGGLGVLQRVASETGGEVEAARGPGELRGAFARIAESLSGRYLLGFEPPDPARPGLRLLEVKVSRPGVKVIARRGYRMDRETPGPGSR